MSDITCPYDQKVALPANVFSNGNRQFKGWNTAADGTGDSYENVQEVWSLTGENGGKVTLYAQWGGLSLAQLQKKFPHGRYWNHKVTKDSEQGDNLVKRNDNSFADTTTDEPCANHKGDAPIGENDCNVFEKAKQCCGFLKKLAYDAYESYIETLQMGTDRSSIKAGDIIHYYGAGADIKDGHWVMVIGVKGNILTLAEGNYAQNCKINWGRMIDKTTFDRADIYSAPYELH